ncbi:transcription-repair coupling factor [Dongia deserti]|uniref:transcription-repair coupling factor n=1 Tax=Dongia deserti TaxID=2268030 RepID=UPI0025472E42|nr:transcription-repair coupling factor [Dongia deserti]
MSDLPFVIPALGRHQVGGAPDGADALLIARLAGIAPGGVLHVAQDDLRMSRTVEMLGFMAPDLTVISFPAWDCLPYDRASPHRDILARRIDALTRLGAMDDRARAGLVVVTTVAAILQRVPAPAEFKTAARQLTRGGRLDQGELVDYLVGKGYARTGTVGEPGEFAVRGGIVDLFPPGTNMPIRVDFFGDEIEDLRLFDPLSQRSLGKIDDFALKPINELQLAPQAIEHFRTNYRSEFGTSGADDPLYEAISAGRQYPGMEHWLPLFGTELVPFESYLPRAIVTLDHQMDEAIKARLEMIQDFFQARRDLQATERESGAPVYRPLPVSRLYIGENAWREFTEKRVTFALHPFQAPDEGGWLNGFGRFGKNFAEARANPDVNLYHAVAGFTRNEQQQGRRVLLAAASTGALERIGHLLAENGVSRQETVEKWDDVLTLPAATLGRAVLSLSNGFIADGVTVLTEQDILGDRLIRTVAKKKKVDAFLTELANFHAGDYVVHVDHGIGRYEGLVALDVGGAPHDCLRVIYDGGDKLFVPVENIDVLSRYGGEEAIVALDKLGGAAWQARKARVKQRIRDIAEQLMKTAALRQIKSADVLQPAEGMFDEFCARFPYAETEDQQRAIAEVIADLANGRPMDRLVCGDVGFGKTEVALRAAFVAAMSGKQVAVVTPTTLLCRQHFKTFAERLQGFPVTIRQMSRLVTSKEMAETKEMLKAGRVDIVIGTHALLAKGIEFARLGLLIVDEEQHFGVVQKERLKDMRGDVHVLTLTATPIPRTLQLALSNIREMSLITTPPIDRLAVRTFVLPYDPVIVREAIMREHFRGGQIFYVCPRIEDLDTVAARLRSLVPEIKFVMAHGRMPATQLEKAMNAFYDGSYELLLATNIIESGLDIPTANTMIIHRADMFGLAQLYQLRGRIGRSKLRGYAYLTTPPGKALTETAQRRLEVMQTLDQLGAGFTLASHDLDIRGAGNLLGDEQSGHVREVGVELYQHLLEEAVREARGTEKVAAQDWTPQINIGMAVLIPESYVQDLNVRLGLYRRLADLTTEQEIDAFAAELIDRFGPLPVEAENLLQVVALKQLCRSSGVERLEIGPKGAVIAFKDNRFARPEKLVEFITKRQNIVTLRTDHRLVYRQDWADTKARMSGVKKLMQNLSTMAA